VSFKPIIINLLNQPIIKIDRVPKQDPVNDHGQAAGIEVKIGGGMKGGDGHRT
jgi:hypothetical protein